MTSRHEPGSRRRRRKIMRAHWSEWVPSPKADEGVRRIPRPRKAYYEKAAALGSESAKTALKRVECPYVIKDKNGKFVTNLCF